MSTPFLGAIDSSTRQPFLIYTIILSAPGHSTIYVRLADREFVDQLGFPYDPLVLEQPNIDQGGGFLSTSWTPSDFDLVVRDAGLSWQARGQRISSLFKDYHFVGAPVYVKQLDLSLSSGQAATMFLGEIADVPATAALGQLIFHVVQGRKWMAPLPPTFVQKNAWPNAPTDVLGVPIPVIYGNFSAPYFILNKLPSGSPNPQQRKYLAGVARAGVPLVTVETGVSGVAPKMLLCSHPVMQGPSVLVAPSDLGQLMGTDYVTIASESDGSMSYAIMQSQAYNKWKVALVPSVVNLSYTAPDPASWPAGSYPYDILRAEKDDLLSGCVKMESASMMLSWNWPDVSSLGKFVGATMFIWYAKAATVGGVQATGPQFGTVGVGTWYFPVAASDVYPSESPRQFVSNAEYWIADLTHGKPGDADYYEYSSWEMIGRDNPFIAVGSAAGNKLQVHRVTLIVEFCPTRNVTVVAIKPAGIYLGGKPDDLKITVDSFDNPCSTYAVGAADDASGTYSGVANGLIEHPVDIIHHLLCYYGNIAESDIVKGSAFGSLIGARNSLPSYKAACYFPDKIDVEEAITRICDQFLLWVFRSTFDATWKVVPWLTAPAVNYRPTGAFTFSRDWVIEDSLSVGLSAVSKVRNSIIVNYDYDWRTHAFSGSVYVTCDPWLTTDSRGYVAAALKEQRDQNGVSPNNREARAAASVTAYGVREQVYNLTFCNDAATATDVRNRLFDLLSTSRAEVRFETGLNACDLERGQVIQLGSDWDAFKPYPKQGSDGSWAGKPLMVTDVARAQDSPARYAVSAVGVEA